MSATIPTFYSDEDGVLQPSARRRRARLYRRRYRAWRWAALSLPLLVAALGFGALVWHEHAWRQATAEDRVAIATLRGRVAALQRALEVHRAILADERCEEFRDKRTGRAYRWCRLPMRGDS